EPPFQNLVECIGSLRSVSWLTESRKGHPGSRCATFPDCSSSGSPVNDADRGALRFCLQWRGPLRHCTEFPYTADRRTIRHGRYASVCSAAAGVPRSQVLPRHGVRRAGILVCRTWRIRLEAYGARLESGLGSRPHEFESRILRST